MSPTLLEPWLLFSQAPNVYSKDGDDSDTLPFLLWSSDCLVSDTFIYLFDEEKKKLEVEDARRKSGYGEGGKHSDG